MPDGKEAPAVSKAADSAPEASPIRLPLAEETQLLEESSSLKTTANTLFTTAEYSEAITGYDRAVALLPTYLDYDLAVLRSNMAACHIKLSEWKEAVESATAALEGLNRVDPLPELPKEGEKIEDINGRGITPAAEIVELDDATAERIEILTDVSKKTLSDVQKLRIKTLLRRAKARSEQESWSTLQGALEDYKQLSAMAALTATDRKTVDRALKDLPPKLDSEKDKEMADMMGKIKSLGNGMLKPFGLSTENFQFVKDGKSGGYSMNFNQNPGK